MNVKEVLGGYLKGCVWVLVLAVCQAGCHHPRGNADSLSIQSKEANDNEARNHDIERFPLKWEQLKVTSYKYLNNAINLHFVDAEYGWAVGWKGLILHTTDAGSNWAPQRSGTRIRLRDVYFANRSIGWAIGGDLVGNKMEYVLLHTDDGGAVWQKKDLPIADVQCKLHFLDPDTGWLVGWDVNSAGRGVVAQTTDGGQSWIIYKIPRDSHFPGDLGIGAVSFVSRQEGWAVSDSTIRHTVDGGATWEIQYVKPEDMTKDYHFQWVQFLDGQTGWAGGTNEGETGHRTGMVRTTDGGKSWEETFPKQLFNAFRFMNHRVGIGVGYVWRRDNNHKASSSMSDVDGVVVLTTDGGKSWLETYRVAGDNMLNVCITQDGNAWILGDILLRFKP